MRQASSRRGAPGYAKAQKPVFGIAVTGSGPAPKRSGSFVVTMATTMSATSGSAARRVNSPRTSSAPQPTSIAPTASAHWGGKPILANRPGPWFSKRNFTSPEERNTPPTASRTRMVARTG